MSEYIESIKELLSDNEKIIFKNIQTMYVRDAIQAARLIEIKDTEIYISDLANIYIYNKKFNFNHYFKQGEKIRRFIYEEDEGNIIVHMKNVRFRPKKKNVIFSFADISIDLKIKRNEFENIKSKSQILLFKGKDEIEDEKDSEVEENVLLYAENLYKLYGNNKEEFAALKGVNFKIYNGDFVCIMGPSGSGKSTLIKLLSTMDEPSRGCVKFKGKNLNSMTEKEVGKFRYENLGFIFQDFNLMNNLTVKENIALPLILASKTQKEIDSKVDEITKMLNINEILNKYPYECSGGQDQRVACARALVTNPQIIMADEPTGNLDTKNSHELLKMLQELNNKGTSIVMVTHDNMIASYSKRLLFIRDGKIEKLLERGDLSQKEYFYKIVDITSKESQALIDIL